MEGLLKFWKVCESWVLRELKNRENMNEVGLSLQHLSRYADKGEDTIMLNRAVTEDESWVHH
jgi:DNA-binding Xre family transcriptional regulator